MFKWSLSVYVVNLPIFNTTAQSHDTATGILMKDQQGYWYHDWSGDAFSCVTSRDIFNNGEQTILVFQGPLLLTWINFNPSMDK